MALQLRAHTALSEVTCLAPVPLVQASGLGVVDGAVNEGHTCVVRMSGILTSSHFGNESYCMNHYNLLPEYILRCFRMYTEIIF